MNRLDFDPEQLNQTIFHRYGTIMHSENGLIIRINRRNWLFNGIILAFVGLIAFVGFSVGANFIHYAGWIGLPALFVLGLLLYMLLYADPTFSILLSEDKIIVRSQGILGKEMREELLFADIAKIILIRYRHQKQEVELRFRVKTAQTDRESAPRLEVLAFLGHVYYDNQLQGKLNREIILFLADKIQQLSGAAVEEIEEDYPSFD